MLCTNKYVCANNNFVENIPPTPPKHFRSTPFPVGSAPKSANGMHRSFSPLQTQHLPTTPTQCVYNRWWWWHVEQSLYLSETASERDDELSGRRRRTCRNGWNFHMFMRFIKHPVMHFQAGGFHLDVGFFLCIIRWKNLNLKSYSLLSWANSYALKSIVKDRSKYCILCQDSRIDKKNL